jgi:hypothetical protein
MRTGYQPVVGAVNVPVASLGQSAEATRAKVVEPIGASSRKARSSARTKKLQAPASRKTSPV